MQATREGDSGNPKREDVCLCLISAMGDATVIREQLGLTVREYQVLDYVRGHRPRPVPFEELNDAVFGEYAAASRARFTVCQVRRKLGPAVLVTVYGFGVRFGLGRVVEALPRCPDCGRPIVPYQDEWVCFACGSQGNRRQIDAVELDVGRAAYEEGTNQGKSWTEDEVAFVLANMDRMSDREMGEMLGGRTASSVRGQRKTNGLGRKRYVRRAR